MKYSACIEKKKYTLKLKIKEREKQKKGREGGEITVQMELWSGASIKFVANK